MYIVWLVLSIVCTDLQECLCFESAVSLSNICIRRVHKGKCNQYVGVSLGYTILEMEWIDYRANKSVWNNTVMHFLFLQTLIKLCEFKLEPMSFKDRLIVVLNLSFCKQHISLIDRRMTITTLSPSKNVKLMLRKNETKLLINAPDELLFGSLSFLIKV